MIEEVVPVQPQLEALLFGDPEVLEEADIGIEKRRPVDRGSVVGPFWPI
jgi:hypothetical protein